MSDPTIRLRHDRTPFETFLNLPENGALDFLMERGDEPNLLLDWMRSARSDQELLSIHAVLSEYFEDLSLPFLDCRFVAALAAACCDPRRVNAIIRRLPLSEDAVAMALTKVRRDWHAPPGWEGSTPYILTVLECLIAAGADPTRVRWWKPFVHPIDMGLKEAAAKSVVGSRTMTATTLSAWINGPALARDDARIIEAQWVLRVSEARTARAA